MEKWINGIIAWATLTILFVIAHPSIAYSAEPICNRGDILLCEDWADGDHDGWSGGMRDPFVWAIVGTGGFTDANALKLTIPENGVSTAWPGHSIPEQQGQTYARFYLRYEPGFVFNPGWSGGKVAYFRALGAGGKHEWRIQIALRGKENDTRGFLLVDLRHMESIDPSQPKYLQNNKGNDIDIESGQWYAVELMVKPNTPGLKDGEVKLWINGVLQMHHTGQNLRGNSTRGINDFWITSYFGGAATIHPEQSVWYDSIVVSKNYVGPFPETTDATPPNAPTGVSIIQ